MKAGRGFAHDRVRRWVDLLTEYLLDYRHRRNENKEIKIADGLSRLDPACMEETVEWTPRELPGIHALLLVENVVGIPQVLPIKQSPHSAGWFSWYGKIWAYLLDGEASLIGQDSSERKLVRGSGLTGSSRLARSGLGCGTSKIAKIART